MHEVKAMNISGINAPATTTPPPAAGNGLTGNDFLTLLTAQLKSQDPLQPQDPTAFVGQLVQFNSLQQLIDINQTLTRLGPPTPAAAPAGASATSASTAAATHHSIGQTLVEVAKKIFAA
jgi:flagellar basal-body rod modification protein FlgD